MNRVLLLDLPSLSSQVSTSVPVPPDLYGKPMYAALSAHAIREAVRAALQPPASLVDERNDALLPWFDSLFDVDNTPPAAQQIALEKGRVLGHLLLTLTSGTNRDARADWSDAHWDYWRTIRQVILGGGLLRGGFGAHLCYYAQTYLHEHGASHLRLRRSPYGDGTPLIGAARFAPPDSRHALVLDCGGTAIKRGLAVYQDSTLIALHRFAPLPSGCDLNEDTLTSAQAIWSTLRAAVRRTWHDAQQPAIDSIQVSLACYIQGGQPFDRGCYGSLRLLSENFASFAAHHLDYDESIHPRRPTSYPLVLTLLHDGTAAAAAFAGEPDTAVLTLGTAIGIGFPPSANLVCSVGSLQSV